MDLLYFTNVPVLDMREHPTLDSKIVSQSFFSESVTLQTRVEGWDLITTSDDYSGWVVSDQLVSSSNPYERDIRTCRLRSHLYAIADIEYGPFLTLPYGVNLTLKGLKDSRWAKVALPNNQECYVQQGDIARCERLHHKSELVSFSFRFLGLPYTWGGRTSFGFDCSGFVQMLYGELGIQLQRDARQQIVDPRFRDVPLDDLEPGDLLFFGRSQEKIEHVGMSIGEGQFIHASSRENQPWIRISQLDDFEWSGQVGAHYPYRVARQF